MSRRWTIVLLAVSLGVEPAGTLKNNVFQLQDETQQEYLQAGTRGIPACTWSKLNETVHGRLHVATPFAEPCFNGDTPGNDACVDIQRNYLDPGFRSDHFGAYINSQWEACQALSEQCVLNWLDPSRKPSTACYQGAVSSYYIDVHDHTDVVAAFVFSEAYGVPLVVKNTGHDYMGRSSARNSLGIWTHRLKSITYVPDFRPKGCPARNPVPAVTFGSGAQFSELLDFATERNITIPGGSDATVGVGGGYLQGGGHSPLSNIFGLAVDRVLEYQVVVPTGDVLFVNDCENRDLFFALNGGGGGTFGVVMSVTTRALPRAELVTVSATFTPETSISKFLEFVIPYSEQWSEDGWSGYIYTMGLFHLSKTNMNADEALAYMAPLKVFLASELNTTLSVTVSSSYGEFHEKFLHKSSEGLPKCIPVFPASRLIPATTFSKSPQELLDTITDLISIAPVSFIFANAPYGFKPYPDAGPTSVTPAWRTSVWDVTFGQVWDYAAPPSVQEKAYRGLSAAMEPLRALTPDGGAYGNEADIYEPNFEESFWGNNYEQLMKIKEKYDPGHLLDCWHCVGWRAADDRYSCYF
ncbi:FAD-binding domain-containing protein [Hymenopellis radicata]|nr:FAD-binding domain-containing protein [Hymenopellis radicata]